MIRKRRRLESNWLFPVFALLSLLSFLFAAAAEAEEIRSFDVDIKTFKDSSFLVTEKIDYDFGDVERHGIHRVIPILYTRGHDDYRIDLKLDKVIDERGTPYEVQKLISGEKVNIRIGSPGYTMKGRHLITVQYRVRHGVNFFDGTPEIVWNVTGHDWHVPIARATCTVHPPEGVASTSIRFESYSGRRGEKETGESRLNEDGVVLSSSWLRPGDHFMTRVGFPEGSIRKPDNKLSLLWWLEDWWPAFVFPAFTAFALGAIFWKFGRDPHLSDSGALSDWTSPDLLEELRPAQLGTVIDERCDMHDIVATVLDLCHRGHLRIKQLSREDPYGFEGPSIQFIRCEPSAEGGSLLRFEQEFLRGMFGSEREQGGRLDDSVFLGDLKFQFQSRIPVIRSSIYESLVQDGYFQTNPHEERKVYYSLALILLIVGAMLLFLASEVSSVVGWAVGLLLSAGISAALAPYMPSRTHKGCLAVSRIQSLTAFLLDANLDEIEAMAKAEPNLFGRILPYAMVLGLEDRWATCFSSILKEPPSWYEPLDYFGAQAEDEAGRSFDARAFVLELGSCVRTMQSDLVASPPPAPTAFKLPVAQESGSGSGFGAGGYGPGGP